MAVTLEKMKAHLNVTFSDDDALITDKIAAAQSYIEAQLGYVIADEYPDGAPALDEAVKQIVAHYYEHRESVMVGVSAGVVPMSARDTIDTFRKWNFGHVE